MKQGYNDRMDDSLGNRDGKKSSKEQNYKDRRDEAKAMNKAEGKRAYQSVDTMDKKSFDDVWAKFKADTKKAFGGKYADGGGVGESDDCPEYFLEVQGDTQKAYELLKKARWFDETSTRVYNDLEDIKGFVSNHKESLSRAETYLDSKGISTSVIYNLKDKFFADFEELQSEDGNNSIFTTMYFAIEDRINPDDGNDTMTLVETANENALNSGLIYDLEELGKRPLYKEIAETALKNIRKFWGENIKEIYLSKIPKYIKSEMPKEPTLEDAERIANKGAAMFSDEFEKKFKEYLNLMEGGFAKGYAKGGGVDSEDWLFISSYPTATVYSDKTKEEYGDYKEIARVYNNTKQDWKGAKFTNYTLEIYSDNKKYKPLIARLEKENGKGIIKMAHGGKIFNLEPVDGRKSFYGKAKGINLGNTTQLQSYDTIVAEYDNVNKKMTINDYYSPTTARHINSFLDYYGYPTMSKSEMLAVKGTKFAKGGMISSNYFNGMLSFLNY